MKIVGIIVRVLLGAAFVFFGVTILHPFFKPPSGPTGLAADFAGALMKSHYMYVVGVLQVLGGLLLLTGRFAPLGLTLLGPVVVNILLFHIFLEPTGLPMAIVFSVLTLIVLWNYRAAFAGILKAKGAS
jgi:uncharacterized membrane protein YphA (DoxX/SURF4 family)